MKSMYLRMFIAVAMVLGIALLANGQAAWAVQDNASEPLLVKEQGESAPAPAKPGPGSVKPPPAEFHACENGFYSVGGVVTLEIKDLKPGYCVEAVLWNPRFQIKRIPDGVGQVLAHMLFLRIYYAGRLTYEVPAEDGSIETCYAIPPEKQAQFYFYDFYGKRFHKRSEPPKSWDQIATRVDDGQKTACAFTQVSGVYALIGK